MLISCACPPEAELINTEGAVIRIPVRGREGLVEINSKKLPGKMAAGGTTAFDPKNYDLVVLAMQEPQYRSPGVRELLQAVAKSRKPCMSIMNMPPLPFLKRIPSIDADAIRDCYTEAAVWDAFDPATMTLCSPDPQAFRPPEDKVNVLQVRLPTNFKSARFESDAHTQYCARWSATWKPRASTSAGSKIELPVKLKVHESVFVPLAKWAMLCAGNYRCVQADAMRPIKGRGAQRPRRLARGLRLGGEAVRVAGRESARHGALRQIRQRGAVVAHTVVGGARACQRRAQYRARGPAGADHRARQRACSSTNSTRR